VPEVHSTRSLKPSNLEGKKEIKLQREKEKRRHITTKTKAPQRHHHKKKNTLYEERSKDQPQVGYNNKRTSNSPNPTRPNMTP
jgi:hypothetical protein